VGNSNTSNSLIGTYSNSDFRFPKLWQKDFVDKYDSFVQLVAKIYPAESVPSTAELVELLAKM